MNLVGRIAPAFHAQAYVGGDFKQLKLDDFAGRWLVLFFYPLDFTFVCPTELDAFGRAEADFQKRGISVVAASTDSVYSHKAWLSRDLPDVRYPVLADVTKQISKDYGVLAHDEGVAQRATFVIDPEGIVRYQVVSSQNVGRSVEETLRVCDALQTGELCPADWKRGEKTLSK
jgi:peroxiredoxin (alkyl hydroperoxide reductase subunit C)